MSFFADQDVYGLTIRLLRDQGHDVLPVARIGLAQAEDTVLLETARSRPDVRFTVLCGHTHGEGRAEILPNPTVLTGGARYGDPSVAAVLELPGEPDAFLCR